MRGYPVPLLCFLLCTRISLIGQDLPDFNDAVDPSSLSSEVLFDHLDTSRVLHTPVGLGVIFEELGGNDPVSVETFYQRTTQHHLLRMSQWTMQNGNWYYTHEGAGKTWLIATDRRCTVISAIEGTGPSATPQIISRNCLL